MTNENTHTHSAKLTSRDDSATGTTNKILIGILIGLVILLCLLVFVKLIQRRKLKIKVQRPRAHPPTQQRPANQSSRTHDPGNRDPTGGTPEEYELPRMPPPSYRSNSFRGWQSRTDPITGVEARRHRTGSVEEYIQELQERSRSSYDSVRRCGAPTEDQWRGGL